MSPEALHRRNHWPLVVLLLAVAAPGRTEEGRATSHGDGAQPFLENLLLKVGDTDSGALLREKESSSWECMSSKMPHDIYSDIFKAVRALHNPLQDLLLVYRKVLSTLSDKLAVVDAAASDCLAGHEHLSRGVQKLASITTRGDINHGFCSFKRSVIYTIGGEDVTQQIHKLQSTIGKGVPSPVRLGKQLGLLLRKVGASESDGNSLPIPPVNWELREEMFGSVGKEEL
mmetsp:Transcript_57340/g.136298  ORF Transcript_57340/g.136298 Transcript_57340/m.136298 type:complete len:229 (+) Transcript_57340:97-783(+)